MKTDTRIHDNVMKKVIAFEKRRTYSWAARFLVVAGIFTIGMGVSLWAFGAELMRRQSLELLDIFQEDWEIIGEYWRDTAGVFFEELPNEWLFIALFACAGLCLVVWATTTDRKRIVQRIRDLALYGRIQKKDKKV